MISLYREDDAVSDCQEDTTQVDSRNSAAKWIDWYDTFKIAASFPGHLGKPAPQ